MYFVLWKLWNRLWRKIYPMKPGWPSGRPISSGPSLGVHRNPPIRRRVRNHLRPNKILRKMDLIGVRVNATDATGVGVNTIWYPSVRSLRGRRNLPPHRLFRLAPQLQCRDLDRPFPLLLWRLRQWSPRRWNSPSSPPYVQRIPWSLRRMTVWLFWILGPRPI